MERKDINSFVLIGFIVLLLYVFKEMAKNKASKLTTTPKNPNEKCVPPDFKDVIVNIDNCRGSFLDENKILELGSFGCEVIVLQQRLNQLEQINILPPTGKFDCPTLEKLKNVKEVPTISLNDFQAVEQGGLDTLTPSNVYSTQRYMDLK